MWVSAESLGPGGARRLLHGGTDEVLIPCIGHLEEAAARAASVPGGPVTLHVPANRVADCEAAVEVLVRHGLESALVVSGNPGHGPADPTVYQLIACLRANGIHVSVGAYPESWFSRTGPRHRMESAGILADKEVAGAQRIVTQASFNADNMAQWIWTIRSHGVDLPVQVGLMAPVPRRALAATLRSARAELFRHPRGKALSRENLDMVFRMLRSRIPDPARFLRAVVRADVLRPADGMHVFTYGRDIADLIATIHALQRNRAHGGNETETAEA
jgi:hypothetical protein